MSHRGGFYADAVLSNSQLDTDFDSQVDGSIAKRHLLVTVDPSGESTRILTARRDEVSFVSENDLISPGVIRAHDSAITIASLGSVDYSVGSASRFSYGASAVVGESVGYEVLLDSISATSQVTTFTGYLFPDLSVIPNSSQITEKVAFANLDPDAKVVNHGLYLTGDGQQLAPANHPGYIPSRYYAMDYDSLVNSGVVANQLYFNTLYVPYRVKLSEVNASVVSTVSGLTEDCTFAIYNLVNGVLSGVVQSVVTTMPNGGLSVADFAGITLEPGMYAIAFTTDAPATLLGSYGKLGESRLGRFGVPTTTGQANKNQAILSLPHTYGDPLPALDSYLPVSVDDTDDATQPIFWFSVEV